MADVVEQARERVRLANDRLDEVWPHRADNPERVMQAVDELNDAGAVLAQALNAEIGAPD